MSNVKTVLRGVRTVLLATLVWFIVLELLAQLYLWIADPFPRPFFAFEHIPAFREEPWAAEYMQEYRASYETHWEPYLYWRRKPYDGRLIHIEKDGLRRSWQDSTRKPDPLTVFFFGGSTTWGTAARDDHTIPSYLSKHLSRHLADDPDRAVHVVNFGESGYVSTQEVILLMQQLQQGHVPDLAIFVSGSVSRYGRRKRDHRPGNRRRRLGVVGADASRAGTGHLSRSRAGPVCARLPCGPTPLP